MTSIFSNSGFHTPAERLVGSGVGCRGGGQKSASPKYVKCVLQYCHIFFTMQHLTGSWVNTYLLLRVAGFQPAKKNGTTGPFCTPQPPLSSQAWKHRGAYSYIGGYDTQDHDLGCMLCIEASLDIFCWLSKVSFNVPFDKMHLLYLFPHQRKCSKCQHASGV